MGSPSPRPPHLPIVQPPFQFLRRKVHMKPRYTRLFFRKSLYKKANCNIAHLKQINFQKNPSVDFTKPTVGLKGHAERERGVEEICLAEERRREVFLRG